MKGVIFGKIINLLYNNNINEAEMKDFASFKEFRLCENPIKIPNSIVLMMTITNTIMDIEYIHLEHENVITESVKEHLIECGQKYKEDYFDYSYEKHKFHNINPIDIIVGCSYIGYIAKSEKEAQYLAELVATTINDDEDIIKSASFLARSIYMLHNGMDMEEFKQYSSAFFDMSSFETVEDDLSIQQTMKSALSSFVESSGFEDSIKRTLLVEKNKQEIIDITCLLADAYYGIPDEAWNLIKPCLREDVINIVDKLYSYQGNIMIDELDLSTRAYNSLRHFWIFTIEDIKRKFTCLSELLKIRNLGREAAIEIMEKVKRFGVVIEEDV